MQDSGKARQSFSIILFDLGNVLVKVDYPAFLRTLGFDHTMTEGELYELLERDSRAYETGKVTAAEFLAIVNRKLQSSYSFDEFRKAWVSILPSPVEGTPELAKQLSGKYSLMLLSNTNEIHFRHSLGILPVLRAFKRYFLSYEIGALKPDPSVYQYVLQHVDVPPERVFFIDDSAVNIQVAGKAGITGIVFQGIENLRVELKKLKVLS